MKTRKPSRWVIGLGGVMATASGIVWVLRRKWRRPSDRWSNWE